MAGFPENQKNIKNCKDLAPKGHLKIVFMEVDLNMISNYNIRDVVIKRQ